MDQNFFRRAVWRGYLLAAIAFVIAFAARFWSGAWLPPGFPYLTFFPAVVLVAYFAGLRPAIVTAALSGLAAWWFWIGPPGFDFAFPTLVALGFFVFVVAVDIFFITGMDAASRRLAREVERNKALAKSRDVLLREVQHRVSNNLQVVSALLNLEARGSADPEARRALADASARTGLVARIQRSLADADQQETAFNALARSIVDDALSAAGRDDVSVSISSGEVALSAEEATPVVLILLECVNNALEHAFPGRPGQITITLWDDGAFRNLTIADDGDGLAEVQAGEPSTLGLKIITSLAQQLRGEWSLRPAQIGACARLRWPGPARRLPEPHTD